MRLPIVLALCALVFGALLGSEAGRSTHRADLLAHGDVAGVGGWK
jgi:hypothetical protein